MSGDGPEWDEFKRAFEQACAEEDSQWEHTERARAEENSRWERNQRGRAEQDSRWERAQRARAEENSRWERTERARAEENSRWERNQRDRAEEVSRRERAERLAKSIAETIRSEVSVALGDALANKRVEVFSAKAGFEPDKWNQSLARAAGLDLPKGLELDPPEPERKVIRDFRGLGYGY